MILSYHKQIIFPVYKYPTSKMGPIYQYYTVTACRHFLSAMPRNLAFITKQQASLFYYYVKCIQDQRGAQRKFLLYFDTENPSSSKRKSTLLLTSDYCLLLWAWRNQCPRMTMSPDSESANGCGQYRRPQAGLSLWTQRWFLIVTINFLWREGGHFLFSISAISSLCQWRPFFVVCGVKA